MIISEIDNKLNFIPEGIEYLKVEVISTENETIFEGLLEEEKTIPMTYIGKYQIYTSLSETFLDTPERTIYNYDMVVEHIVCKYLSLFCPCDDCKSYEPCSKDESQEILCLFNEVYSFIHLHSTELLPAIQFTNHLFNSSYYNNIVDSLHKQIYVGEHDCCEKESVETLTILVLTLYYIYVQKGTYTTEEIEKLFNKSKLFSCVKKMGICLDTLLEALEDYFGPSLYPPEFTGFRFNLQIDNTAQQQIVTYDFTLNDFESNYSDPQNLQSKNIKIVSLPNRGNLMFDGNVILTTPFEFPKEEVTKLVYQTVYDRTLDTDKLKTPTLSFEQNIGGLNNSIQRKFYDTFKAQMSNTQDLYSNVGNIYTNIFKLKNLLPTQIGNNLVELENRETYIFTVADFTTDTVPPYEDPENNPVEDIILRWIQLPGKLYIQNSSTGAEVPVGTNQIIPISAIASGRLRYESPNTNSIARGEFSFGVRDEYHTEFFTSNIYGIFTIISNAAVFEPIVAEDDIYSIQYHSSNLFNVLENDDYYGNVSIQIVTQPNHGVATVEGNQIRYAHGQNKELQDTLTYKIIGENVQSNIATVTITVAEEGLFYYGDVDQLPTNYQDIIDNLETDTLSYNRTYSFVNDEKRKNVILVPKTHILDTVITSNQENIRPNFNNVDFSFTDNEGNTYLWDMYYHSSVLPLNVEINFKLRN